MKKTILVVEDIHSLARMIQAVLVHADFAVEHAENGEVALQRLKEREYDLIMLDLMMPVMDGRDFLQHLRIDQENTTPVVVYTGSQHEDLAQELLASGANHVAYKPLGAQKLIDLVTKHIN